METASTASLLQLNTSLFSSGGQSSQLADRIVAAWRVAHPGAAVVVRDLASKPLPHLDAERFLAFIGIHNVELVDGEGLNMAEANKQLALADAQHRLQQLAA